ncbi:hypothetical protein LRN87_16530, partial [Escherichia coli]|nr:hypothetical protein [Escherichia coli]
SLIGAFEKPPAMPEDIYFCQTAFSCCVWLRFPFGNSLPAPQRIFELFLHPLIVSIISFYRVCYGPF